MLINVGKLHEELAAAGLPVVSVHSDGKIDYSRLLSKAEELKVEELINAHDPVVVSKPTPDQMILALWKKVMLGDSTDADKILEMLN
jgi:predicted acyltransferase (DUF342 family)